MRFKKVMTMVLAALVFSTVNGFCDGDGLFLDDNGNVGVGTATPASTLHVVTDGIPFTPDTASDDFVVGSSTNTGISIQSDPAKSGRIVFARTGDPEEGGVVYDHNTDYMRFDVNSSEKVRIDNRGYVGIGTKSPQALLHLKADTTFEAPAIIFEDTNPDDSREARIYQQAGDLVIEQGNTSQAYEGRIILIDGGTIKMENANGYLNLSSSGNVGVKKSVPSYTLDVGGTIRGSNVSPSDARWKTNVTTLENALEKVINLRGVRYEWTDSSKGIGDQLGLIAQEVETVFPEVVSTDNQGYKSVAYSKLVAPLIEAVKQLQKENQELKQRIEALERQ